MNSGNKKSRQRKTLRIPGAESRVPDCALIQVHPQVFDAFLAALEAPVQPNPRLRRAMQATPPWLDR